MILGLYDADPKKPSRVKLATAIARYKETFGSAPRFCLTSPQDAADLAVPSRTHPMPDIDVQARGYIARWTYYVGEERPAPEPKDAEAIVP